MKLDARIRAVHINGRRASVERIAARGFEGRSEASLSSAEGWKSISVSNVAPIMKPLARPLRVVFSSAFLQFGFERSRVMVSVGLTSTSNHSFKLKLGRVFF